MKPALHVVLPRALCACLALAGSSAARAALTPVESGQATQWRYLDNNQRPPPGWMQPGFEDQTWLTGGAPLGFGEPDITTRIRFGARADAKAPATYFRHTFTLASIDGVGKAVIALRVDDGALVFLNGREVGRVNLPAGKIDHATTTTDAIGGDDEYVYHVLPVPVSALVAGPNVLAVEVHQCNGSSTDLFFDLQLKVYAADQEPAPEDTPIAGGSSNDPIVAGLAALRQGQITRAIELLGRAPETHPRFQAAMLQAGRTLAETNGRPELGAQLVARAYRRDPDAQPVAYAWARAQLLARTNLHVPFASRPHAATVPDKWQWIVAGPGFEDRSKRFPRAQLEADLDYLETMIANGYSYAERLGADWRGALDAVRASLDRETGVTTFTLRLQRAFTVFGDPHSSLRPAANSFPPGFLPFSPIGHTGNRVVAVRPDRSGFVDAGHPYLIALDGRPLADWLRVAGWDVPQASPQYRWHLTVRALTWLNYLRGTLGLAAATDVRATLASEDGSTTKEVTLRVAERPTRAVPQQTTSPAVRDGIGYLRVEAMLEDEKFLDGLDEAMRGFRATRGLILDARGNRGGTQDALCRLMPYFLPPGAPMRIVNVAAYRIPVNFDRLPREGFLPANRFLHPIGASVWNEAQRRQIDSFLVGFQPGWKLPPGQFSPWHVMGLRHESNPHAYFYDRPVIVLSDAGVFSAGDNFLGALKGTPNVTLLGTASGGGSGRMAGYVLPNTKLALTLCQMASFRATGALYEGAGVEPDIVLEAKPTDHLLAGGDSVLEAAMARLSQRNRPRKRPPIRRRRGPSNAPPSRMAGSGTGPSRRGLPNVSKCTCRCAPSRRPAGENAQRKVAGLTAS